MERPEIGPPSEPRDPSALNALMLAAAQDAEAHRWVSETDDRQTSELTNETSDGTNNNDCEDEHTNEDAKENFTDADDGESDETIRRRAYWDSARPSVRQAAEAQQFLVSALQRFAWEDAVSQGRPPAEVLAERLNIDPDDWAAGQHLLQDIESEAGQNLGREDETTILPLDWDSHESPRFRFFQSWMETAVRRRSIYPKRSRTRDVIEMGYGKIPKKFEGIIFADPTRRDSEHVFEDLDAYGAIPEPTQPWFWSQPYSVTSWPHKHTITSLKTLEEYLGCPLRRSLRYVCSDLLRNSIGIKDFQIQKRDPERLRKQALEATSQVRDAWKLAWGSDPVEARAASRTLGKLRWKYLGKLSRIQLWDRVDQETCCPQTKDHRGQWINRPELRLDTRIIKAIWQKTNRKIKTPVGIAWIRNTALPEDLTKLLTKAIPASHRGPKRWVVQTYFDCIASGHASL